MTEYDPKKPNKALVAAVMASVISGLSILVTEFADAIPLWVLIVCVVVIASLTTFTATYFVKNPTQ